MINMQDEGRSGYKLSGDNFGIKASQHETNFQVRPSYSPFALVRRP